MKDLEALFIAPEGMGVIARWYGDGGGRPDHPLHDAPMTFHLANRYRKNGSPGAMIHLNGHANEASPVAEVRIPVQGIQHYCDYLRGKISGDEKPEVVDPRYEGEGTDMNIYDPSGNLLVFWKA